MKYAKKPSDYEAIKLWGEARNSFPYYIESQQLQAFEDNAPLDAIYFSDSLKRWVLMRDLAESHPFHQQYVEYK